MTEQHLRRLSLAEGAALAEELALRYAIANGVEGELLSITPDQSVRKIGKVPVTWGVVFTAVHRGVEFDGPIVLTVNLEERTVQPLGL